MRERRIWATLWAIKRLNS